MKKRILIVGINGMLGQRCAVHFAKNDKYRLLGISAEPETHISFVEYLQTDITKRDDVRKVIFDFMPDVIINCSAYTNVDGSESNRETAWKVNVNGIEHIAEAARIHDIHIIHFSTDYVFDGLSGPYSERDTPNPINYYGRTKLASENALRISGALYTIIRTNVLFGIIPNGRFDFVRWLVNELRSGRGVRIVNDQVNTPTYIDDLVLGIESVVEHKKLGLYNISGREVLNRYEFTEIICEVFRLDTSLITQIVTSELNQPAPRPLKAGLIILKAETELGFRPTPIKDALIQMKAALGL